MSKISVNLNDPPQFFDEAIVLQFEDSKIFKDSPTYLQKMYKDTGCVPAHVADKLFPLFTPGYYGRLAARGKITGYKIGSSYFVNLRQAWEYTQPKLIDPEQPPVAPTPRKSKSKTGETEDIDMQDIGI